jgi:hypothetical protein
MRIASLAASIIIVAAAAQAAVGVTIQFAGLTWDVKTGSGLGPGPNNWSDSAASVWVDAQNQLHLKIRKVNSTWYCAEVTTQQSFGYGTYLFQIASDCNTFDKNVVVGLFTYLDDNNEIDIEFSRWGVANNLAAQYVTQPVVAGNRERFDLSTAGVNSTHSFTWLADSIFFQSYCGTHTSLPATPDLLIHNWTYTGADIPPESTEKLHLNLWLVGGSAPSNGQTVEVVIRSVLVTDPPSQCTGDPQCDDGLFCTGIETCVSGTCQPGTDPCSGAGLTCDEIADECICPAGSVTPADVPAFVGCLGGPGVTLGSGCACADRDSDGDADLADFASFQAAFTSPPAGVVLFDFESGAQGWISFGEGTTGNGLLPTGGSGGAGPQARYHRADFDTATMTYGFGDASAVGQNLSSYTGMSIDMRLRNPVPADPFVGTPEVEFMLSVGYMEWAQPFTLTDTYRTCAVDFADLTPQNTATQPITPAQLSDPGLRFKLIMRKGTNHGQVELDYDQVIGLP